MANLLSIASRVSGSIDTSGIKNLVDRKKKQRLRQFGAYVRTTARQSIRKTKATSKPGDPPKSHHGALRDLIYFAVSELGDNVTIGPLPFRKRISPIVEYGGREAISVPTAWTVPDTKFGAAGKRDTGGRFKKRTQSVERIKANIAIKAGKLPKRTKIKVTYKPRPFMVPAHEKVTRGNPNLMKDLF